MTKIKGEYIMRCEVKLLSSLEKVFFDKFTYLPEHSSGSMLSNEIYSFQLAIWGEGEILPNHACTIEIESELLRKNRGLCFQIRFKQ